MNKGPNSLHARSAGPESAPAIIFLHAIGTSKWIWEPVAGALAEFRTVLVDLPGHGGSHKVSWQSMAATASQVAGLIERHSPAGKASIVGLSLGAYVTLQLIHDHPEAVDRAVLSSVNIKPLPNERGLSLMGYAMAPFLKSDRFIRMNAESLKIPSHLYGEFAASVRQMPTRAYLAAGRDAAAFREEPALPQEDVPILILSGEDEHPLIRQSQLELLAHLPRATGRIAPSLGHGWLNERPDLYADSVRAWVTDTPLPLGLLRPQEVDS